MDQAQHQGVPINPQLAVRSPIAGVVVQKLVTPGLVIQAGTTACFTISDKSTVWVQGHIYDRDLESVRVGDTVEETDASFHQTFHGAVSYIGALIDPATRTTPVRIVTKNPDDLLKKDMFVDAVIHTRSGTERAGGADVGDSSQRRKSAVRVRGSGAGQIRAAAGEHRRAAGRRNGDRQRVQGGRKDRRRRQRVSPVRQQHPINTMIARIVSFALSQRFMVIMAALALMVWGAISFQKLPIDAYPDLSPPHVEIITQWPGHAAEEVERLISIPLEVEMNGIPKIEALRSISLYGLSALEMNFQYDIDPYFVREQAFERMANATLPDGITPGVSPLFSPSGLIYRYVLVSPDRTPQELKTIEHWVLERRYRAVPGVADDSGLGGTTMQYQVLLNPYRLFSRGVTVPQVFQQLSIEQLECRRRILFARRPVLLHSRTRPGEDDARISATSWSSTNNGIPTYVKDVGEGGDRRRGAAGRVRLHEAGRRGGRRHPDARRRAGAGGAEAACRQLTKELNEHVLPQDVKIVPYYDRSGLIEETTQTVEQNLIRGMLLVLVVLGIFLFSVRAAIIVAITIPFALMFAFICLDWRHIPANLLSIGAIDFGILVDGAVVMVENVFRELAARHGEEYDLIDSDSRRGERRRAADLLRGRGDHRRLSSDLRAWRARREDCSSRWRIPCRSRWSGRCSAR